MLTALNPFTSNPGGAARCEDCWAAAAADETIFPGRDTSRSRGPSHWNDDRYNQRAGVARVGSKFNKAGSFLFCSRLQHRLTGDADLLGRIQPPTLLRLARPFTPAGSCCHLCDDSRHLHPLHRLYFDRVVWGLDDWLDVARGISGRGNQIRLPTPIRVGFNCSIFGHGLGGHHVHAAVGSRPRSTNPRSSVVGRSALHDWSLRPSLGSASFPQRHLAQLGPGRCRSTLRGNNVRHRLARIGVMTRS